jgi:hypothetical protein
MILIVKPMDDEDAADEECSGEDEIGHKVSRIA